MKVFFVIGPKQVGKSSIVRALIDKIDKAEMIEFGQRMRELLHSNNLEDIGYDRTITEQVRAQIRKEIQSKKNSSNDGVLFVVSHVVIVDVEQNKHGLFELCTINNILKPESLIYYDAVINIGCDDEALYESRVKQFQDTNKLPIGQILLAGNKLHEYRLKAHYDVESTIQQSGLPYLYLSNDQSLSAAVDKISDFVTKI